jgi:hypothetical protein
MTTSHLKMEVESTPEIPCISDIKVKVKLSLCFFFKWAPHYEGVLREWMYNSTHSLTSALHGGEWSASRLGRFTPRERAPGTHWIGGWVGPRDVLDAVVKRKIPSHRRESNPRTPIVQRYTDWAIRHPHIRRTRVNGQWPTKRLYRPARNFAHTKKSWSHITFVQLSD